MFYLFVCLFLCLSVCPLQCLLLSGEVECFQRRREGPGRTGEEKGSVAKGVSGPHLHEEENAGRGGEEGRGKAEIRGGEVKVEVKLQDVLR
jgi:hypothetical protein